MASFDQKLSLTTAMITRSRATYVSALDPSCPVNSEEPLCHHPLRRKASSEDSARGPLHRTSCSASPAGKGGAGGAGPNADDLGALGRGPLSALQGCLGTGVTLEVLRCPTANGGGGVEDPLADLTHTEGDLASFERLDVTPRFNLVLRRFCSWPKVLARPDTHSGGVVCNQRGARHRRKLSRVSVTRVGC